METSPQFADSITANISYWHSRLDSAGSDEVKVLDLDRHNLLRAIEFGLSQHLAWHGTADLVIRCFPLIIQRGYYREWIPVLKRVIAGCSPEYLSLKGRLLDQLGILYRRNRQLDEAIATHLEEEQIGQLLDDDSRRAFARMHLSAAYWRKRQHDLAEQYGAAALEGFVGLEDKKEPVASCFVNLGNIALDRGDLELAEERLKRSVVLYRQINQPAALANALKNLSNVYDTAGSYDEALQILIEASDILVPTDLEIDKASLENNIGTLYYRKGELDLAEAAFRRADSHYMRKQGPLYYRGLTANNLGNVMLSRERWDQAEKLLRQSVSFFRQAKAQINLANALSGVAEALVGQDRLAEALSYYEEAIAIATDYPNDAWARRMLEEFPKAKAFLDAELKEEEANHL